ncbi:hypothetical protein HII17_06465 [Thalassotalea sp. M1531]|uniref:Uncharacterized protein n=1 Tax=Thalassotalea algicola TaxID=2716224 RepID=A0A7Y0Q6B7_9GAMM|nr:hypothetical protein [Thalassotalea algicola]NMP31203.1 hypothetical protein [Thalassotalea algicola]
MSALKEEKIISSDIKLIYDLTEKPNHTQLKAHEDRAVIAKLRADLVLPTDKILTVDIDFDTTSGYHGNTMLIMDDYGVEMFTAAIAAKHGQEHADRILNAWNNKKNIDDPRKPTYMLVQKPSTPSDLPNVFVACGDRDHKDIKAQRVS